MRILSIDQGTTNTKTLVVDHTGEILARASCPTSTTYPHSGWAEQSAAEIWAATRTAINEAAAIVGADTIDAISIANQRETFVFWDCRNSEPVAPAILWQCRRTAPECAQLIEDGHNEIVEHQTGLAINPLFPASKLAWMLRENANVRELETDGLLRAGTVDSWLLWNLTAGASFATDHSNASRTQLFDTAKLEWSGELVDIFSASLSCLATPMPSDSRFGVTAEGTTDLPPGIPIHAMMGDSHAALFGHGIREPGAVKATFGTGSSVMMLTPVRRQSKQGLSGTIAWTNAQGTAYALEGNITVSGQASAFMANLLGFETPTNLSKLAETVEDSDGVVFVPALAGLGAPHWSDNATGLITGMTHATQPAHVARATLEAIALQVADVVDAMAEDAAIDIVELRADGGATANTTLMQMQADILGCKISVANIEEVGALGSAAMAFAGIGQSMELSDAADTLLPSDDVENQNKIRENWRAAIKQCLLVRQ